jgi:hypothetical protein
MTLSAISASSWASEVLHHLLQLALASGRGHGTRASGNSLPASGGGSGLVSTQ